MRSPATPGRGGGGWVCLASCGLLLITSLLRTSVSTILSMEKRKQKQLLCKYKYFKMQESNLPVH